MIRLLVATQLDQGNLVPDETSSKICAAQEVSRLSNMKGWDI